MSNLFLIIVLCVRGYNDGLDGLKARCSRDARDQGSISHRGRDFFSDCQLSLIRLNVAVLPIGQLRKGQMI